MSGDGAQHPDRATHEPRFTGCHDVLPCDFAEQ
jgi:hypothetical protein